MWKALFIKSIFTGLLLAGLVAAQAKPAAPEKTIPPKDKVEPQTANRKAYDALYSDIIKTLPRDGKAKVDSVRGRDTQPKQTVNPRTPEDVKKKHFEKRKKELDELPLEVKARVDKVLIDLDNRRKEKKTEFKELK
ncbi:MAG: hypothetical protein JWO30_1895 [Fibrobacteres bacterium]|nr:hypothetical protein [Fibrobacterota bacterium]